MDDFQGTKDIVLYPGMDSVDRRFEITVNSAADANDGFLPYGRTVSSVVVTAHREDEVSPSDVEDLISESSVDTNIVTVQFDYPSTSGAGTYHLVFALTLDNGDVDIAHFNRVFAKAK